MLAGAVFTSWVVLILGMGSLLVLNLIAPGTLDKLTTSGSARPCCWWPARCTRSASC